MVSFTTPVVFQFPVINGMFIFQGVLINLYCFSEPAFSKTIIQKTMPYVYFRLKGASFLPSLDIFKMDILKKVSQLTLQIPSQVLEDNVIITVTVFVILLYDLKTLPWYCILFIRWWLWGRCYPFSRHSFLTLFHH